MKTLQFVSILCCAAGVVCLGIAARKTFTPPPHAACPVARAEYCDGLGYAWCAHGELMHTGYTRPTPPEGASYTRLPLRTTDF